MKRKISIMLLAIFMTVGMSSFAYAYRGGYDHGRGVRHRFHKFERYHHRPFHRFHRHPRYHRDHTVIIEKEYIPYNGSYSSSGTALDFGGVVVQLPQTVIFE